VSDDGVDAAVGPWRRLARRVAYENPWLTIWHDDVVRPDGGTGIYGVVHVRNVAAGVVALDADGRVVLVGQHRYTLDAWSWEIPEGGVPAGEDPLDGARRELREETGIVAARWRELGRTHLSNSVTDEEAVLYLATDLRQEEPEPEATEELTIRWVTFDEALAMALDGRITDAMTILALQRLALERRGPAEG
jgi:8-oxo-dGTP pyrophosphatase MutT (NUDIX family)